MFSHLISVCTQFQQALAVVFLAAPDQINSVKLLEDHIQAVCFWNQELQISQHKQHWE